MGEDEARQMVNELVRLLRTPDVGLSAIVEQHLDDVANGRIVEAATEDPSSGARRRKTEKLLPGDVRRRSLTATEQLSGLLDLVEMAVVGTLDVEQGAVDMAREFLPKDGGSTILFSDDVADFAERLPPEVAADSYSTVTEPDQARVNAATQVLETLRELREVSGVSRAEWLEPQDERLSSRSRRRRR